MTTVLPTNPYGRCFISYRRTRLDEIRRVIAALHDHGIPTWQDETDLDAVPFESALRDTIASPDTASGLLWITPEVADSLVTLDVEIPGLVSRAERGDGFYLQPVTAGGLDHAGAADVTRSSRTMNDFGTWNSHRVRTDPVSDEDAAAVARRVLKQRVEKIHIALPPGAPIVIDVYTRTPVIYYADAALTVNLTHRFDGRQAHPDAWQRGLPALEAIVSSVASGAPHRPIRLRGKLGLPTTVALGVAFMETRSLDAAWVQPTTDRPDTLYSLAAGRVPSGFGVTVKPGRVDARDLAVLVNVRESCVGAVNATSDLPPFRAQVHADPPASYPHLFADPGEAVDLAYEVVHKVRAARREYGYIGTAHLFIAGPVGLAFLLGQLLNTLGPVQTYEHVSYDGVGQYRPAVTVVPTD
ncbi:MAG TPA: SAVED domain-containing protein [Mycobacteriales bacterium]|nr:SAVED domain-containing protein [Mycobacteriales bacterium]